MEDSIEYLDDLNASKCGSCPINFVYWKVNGFPLSNSGQTFLISMLLSKVQKKNPNQGSRLQHCGPFLETVNANASCFDPMDYAVTDDNNTKITISILDTSIPRFHFQFPPCRDTTTTTNYTGYDM